MTVPSARRSLVVMRDRLRTSRNLIIVALTAVVSLAAAHATDLAAQLLGSGPASGWAIAGNLAGLAACAGSAWLGVRGLRRLRCAQVCRGTRLLSQLLGSARPLP